MTQYEVYDHTQKTRLKARNRQAEEWYFIQQFMEKNNIVTAILATFKFNEEFTIYILHVKTLEIT